MDQFNDFGNPESLIWKKKNLIYGDWTSGPNGDGTYIYNTKITPSEVTEY